MAHPVFLFCRRRCRTFFPAPPAPSLARTFGCFLPGFRLRFRLAGALQVLLPAAEKFFPRIGGGHEKAKEVKPFLRCGMDEKTLFTALSRSAQITKEGEKEFARLMADAAGDVKMFAVAGEEGRRKGEGFTEGVESGTLLRKGRGKEEGESEPLIDGGLPLSGARIDSVEHAQGRFIPLITGQKRGEELRLGRAAQYRPGDAVAKKVLQFFAHPRRRCAGD